MDIWREQHGNTREYSFYSSLYKLHVRLDKILCSDQLAGTAQRAEFLGRTISNHSPLVIRCNVKHVRPPVPTWRLPVGAFEDTIYQESVCVAITEYFDTNQNSASSVGIE